MNPTVYLIDQLQSDVERLTRANTELTSENAKLRAALEMIAAGNGRNTKPGKWLADVEMAEIARTALRITS